MSETGEYYQIPEVIFDRDGPYDEFNQDAAIITVELADGRTFSGVLVLYPNYIISVENHSAIPFDPVTIERTYQTPKDHQNRTSTSEVWIIWDHPWKDNNKTQQS